MYLYFTLSTFCNKNSVSKYEIVKYDLNMKAQ